MEQNQFTLIQKDKRNIFILPTDWEENLVINNKLIELGFNELVKFELGVDIKILESCYELMELQNKKIDNIETKLPLLILKNNNIEVNSKGRPSNILNPMEILIKLFKNDNTFIYILSDNNETTFINNLCYLSIHDLNSLINTQISNFTYNYDLTGIISTYVDIIKHRNNASYYMEDSNNYIIDCDYFKFKVYMLQDINQLQNIDINNYDLVIETSILNINPSIINHIDLINIYKKQIKKLNYKFIKE